MDENFNQNAPIGTGEGEVPLTNNNPPKIDIRTMASDIKSVGETGGIETRPYVPPPSMPAKKEFTAIPPSTVPAKEEVFTPPAIEPTQIPGKMDFPELKKPKSHKGLVVTLVTIIVITGLGALGYFVIYPFFFQTPPISSDTNNPPANNLPSNETPPTDQPPVNSPPTSNHVSLFSIPADLTLNKGDALPATLAQGSIVEYLIPGSEILATLPEQIRTFFPDNEISTFSYIDINAPAAGGIILKGKEIINTKQQLGKSIEDDQSFLNSLATTIGTQPSGTWKDGQAGTINTRYHSFSNSNYSVNYGWINDKLIITYTYNAFKEAAKRVQ